MKWKHIEFLNGSNPYICKTEKEFERMQEKYVLVEYKENFYVVVKARQTEIDLSKLTKENRESVLRFAKLLKQCEGLPVEMQQEIIDNIQDTKILEFLAQEKNKLS